MVRVTSPAVTDSGLPLNVPRWATRVAPPLRVECSRPMPGASRSGTCSIERMTSSRPPKAPIGTPPPMLLARQMRSGWTPKYSVAPP